MNVMSSVRAPPHASYSTPMLHQLTQSVMPHMQSPHECTASALASRLLFSATSVYTTFHTTTT